LMPIEGVGCLPLPPPRDLPFDPCDLELDLLIFQQEQVFGLRSL